MYDNSLWNFAVSYYRDHEIQEQCLLLQEACDADIPLVIFSLWLSTKSVRIDLAEWQQVFNETDTWRKKVVMPLRDLRKQLKRGPTPAPCNDTNELREMIKLAELHAEKIELNQLESQLENKKIEQNLDFNTLAKFNLDQILARFSCNQNPSLAKNASNILLERLKNYG